LTFSFAVGPTEPLKFKKSNASSLGTVHEGKKYCYKEVNLVAVCNVLRSVTEAAGTVSKKLTLVTISAYLWSGKLVYSS
jgi:hypothetical protein